MTENTPFNDEWNKLQKAFWDNVGSNYVNSSDSTSNLTTDGHSAIKAQQLPSVDQWFCDLDKCWQDHVQVKSSDIDSLYKKISSSSRFFINFTESVTSTKLGETADDLIEKALKGFANDTPENKTNSENVTSPLNKNSFANKDFSVTDINAFWKIPLENWQQQAGFFANQQYTLSTFSSFFEGAANDPEFFAAIEGYWFALQKYQLVFFNLFKASAKQAVETLKVNKIQQASPKKIMKICLEVLEVNYMTLISEDSYSKAYADVVNSWMLMVSKSNKPFAEFVQAHKSSAKINPDGQSHAK